MVRNIGVLSGAGENTCVNTDGARNLHMSPGAFSVLGSGRGRWEPRCSPGTPGCGFAGGLRGPGWQLPASAVTGHLLCVEPRTPDAAVQRLQAREGGTLASSCRGCSELTASPGVTRAAPGATACDHLDAVVCTDPQLGDAAPASARGSALPHKRRRSLLPRGRAFHATLLPCSSHLSSGAELVENSC